MSVALPVELLWNMSVSIAGGTSMEYVSSIAGGTSMEYVSEHCRRNFYGICQ
jgi:hypothetical protein